MDVPKYIHYDFVPNVNVDIIKRVLNLHRELRLMPFRLNLPGIKRFQQKLLIKKPFKGVPYIMCVIELDMVRA